MVFGVNKSAVEVEAEALYAATMLQVPPAP